MLIRFSKSTFYPSCLRSHLFFTLPREADFLKVELVYICRKREIVVILKMY